MVAEVLQVFLAQAESYLPTIRSEILACAQTGNAYGELGAALRQIGAIKDAALVVELGEAARIAGELEEKLKISATQNTPFSGEQSLSLLDKLTELETAIAQISFAADDSSFQITDFLDSSFDNLGLTESSAASISIEDEGMGDEWGDEFEIDEEMLEIFGEEAEELIKNIESNLEQLAANTDDREALLEVRRNAHTLKGSAGIVGLSDLSEVAHRVEDLLDYLTENDIAGNERIFELLLTSTYCFSALASNDKSPQPTKKLAQLYDDFDALMNEFKSGPADAADVESPEAAITAIDCPRPGNPSEDLELEIPDVQKRANVEQISESESLRLGNQESYPPPEIIARKSVVRVSLDKLDDLVKIMSGLVISRSVFEQRLAELEQQIGELNNSTRRLNFSTNKIETDFEADMLNTVSRSLPVYGNRLPETVTDLVRMRTADNNQKAFDSLELDRYTEFHQTMRELIETTGDTSAINSELDVLKGNLENLFDNQRHLIDEMQDKLLRLRLVSFGSLSIRLQRTVRVTADEEGKSVELIIEGENLEVDTQILDALIEPLLHLLRNAVAHGIELPEARRMLGKPEAGQIRVRVHDEGTHFIMTVTDDGRGISATALKTKAVECGMLSEVEAETLTEQDAFALIFHSGLSTADKVSQVSGRGVGMDIVKTGIMRQQGSISIDSESHKGTTFTIRLPVALAVTRALLVKTGAQTYAVPLKVIKSINRLAIADSLWSEDDRQNQSVIENQPLSTVENHNTETKKSGSSIFHLNELIGLPTGGSTNNENTPVLLLKTPGLPTGLIVDEIVKSEEIVIKSLGSPLNNLPALIGATILGDGSVVPVLDLIYLLNKRDSSAQNVKAATANVPPEPPSTASQQILSVLIVDDSPSVRHLTSNIIKNAGWKASVAKDGVEALEILQESRELPDVILSDVEMPRMNGYELLASLKKQESLQKIPVVMITSRANDKHRQKAVDLGVSEYLTKPFNDAKLIEIIKDLTT